MTFVVYLILFCILFFFIRKFLQRFKFPKTTAISVFTGGVKCGKSAVSLACTVSAYKKTHRRWKVNCFFRNLFRKPLLEEPLLYSNIPLSIPYVELTTDILLRKKRINFGSICFVDECSLLADSQLIKDGVVNTQLLLFFKLYGHSTHGGKLFLNTHEISDLHYAIKRCTSQYFYVFNVFRWLPFFCLAKIREERFSEDGTSVNIYKDDIELSQRTVIFRKSVFKKYDCFCYSPFTDNLPVVSDLVYKDKKITGLKTEKVVSFRKEFQDLTPLSTKDALEKSNKIRFNTQSYEDAWEKSKKEGLI